MSIQVGNQVLSSVGDQSAKGAAFSPSTSDRVNNVGLQSLSEQERINRFLRHEWKMSLMSSSSSADPFLQVMIFETDP